MLIPLNSVAVAHRALVYAGKCDAVSRQKDANTRRKIVQEEIAGQTTLTEISFECLVRAGEERLSVVK